MFWRAVTVLSLAIGLVAVLRPSVFEGLMGSGGVPMVLALAILLLMTSVMVPAFAPLFRGMRRNARLRRRLNEDGKLMAATVLRVVDTNITTGTSPWVEITVRTVGEAEATFPAAVSRVNFPRVGDKLDILYDPADPTVAIKF